MAQRAPVDFAPTQLSGCVLWLRADLGITIATGVSQWLDQKSGLSFAQGTGSKQPTYNTASTAFGGRATMTFAAASSQFLGSPTITHASSSYLCVASLKPTSTGNTSQYLAAQSAYAIAVVTGQSTNLGGWYDAGGWKNVSSATNQTQVLSWFIAAGAGTASMWRNGLQIGSSQGSTATALSGATVIGASAAGSAAFLDAEVAEIVLVDTATTDVRQLLERYMSQRYNIPVT